MNKNEKFVIAINREVGSGGRTVGRKLAEKLGVRTGCPRIVCCCRSYRLYGIP